MLASRHLSGDLETIDLTTGERVVLSPHDAEMPFSYTVKVLTGENLGYALVLCSSGSDAIYAVDLVSGQRVIVSKSLFSPPL